MREAEWSIAMGPNCARAIRTIQWSRINSALLKQLRRIFKAQVEQINKCVDALIHDVFKHHIAFVLLPRFFLHPIVWETSRMKFFVGFKLNSHHEPMIVHLIGRRNHILRAVPAYALYLQIGCFINKLFSIFVHTSRHKILAIFILCSCPCSFCRFWSVFALFGSFISLFLSSVFFSLFYSFRHSLSFIIVWTRSFSFALLHYLYLSFFYNRMLFSFAPLHYLSLFFPSFLYIHSLPLWP